MKIPRMTVIALIALAIALGFLGQAYLTHSEFRDANDQLNKQLMQADLDKGRALTKFGNAQSYIGQLQGDIATEIKERKAWISRYGKLEFKYNKMKRVKSTGEAVYVEGPVIEVEVAQTFVRGMLYEAITDKTLMPIEYLTDEFRDHRLYLKTQVHPHPGPERMIHFEYEYTVSLLFDVQFVESHTPSGAINHYVSIWEMHPKTLKKLGKIPISKFEVVVDKPKEKQWFWWAPHVDVAGLAGFRLTPPDVLLGGSIGFSPMGYGRTVNDLDWRALRVSLDLAGDTPALGLTPVVGNLGQPLPLLSNVWVGPHVSWQP